MIPRLAQLDHLAECLDRGREAYLEPHPQLAALDQALARTRCTVSELEAGRLVVGILGGTGVGKSTLLNALAGREISRAGDRRPTTDRVVGYRHRDFPLPDWLAPDDLGDGVPPHDLDALRGVILLDLPDTDSYRTEHRARVHRIVPRLDLLLVVTSADKYADRALYEELAALPQAPANVIYVLNAIDRLDPAALAAVRHDFADKLVRHAGGEGHVVLPLSALRSREDADAGGLTPLRARLEELGGDAARRRVLEDNTRTATRHLGECWRAYLGDGSVHTLVESLARVPTRLPDPGSAVVGPLRAQIADHLGPWIRDAALRASWFPIGYLHYLWRKMPFRRHRAEHPATAPIHPGAAFPEQRVHLPLRLAAREAERHLRCVEGKLRLPLPAVGSGVENHDAQVLEEWLAPLRRKAPRYGWKLRTHVLPALLLLVTSLWVIRPLLPIDGPEGDDATALERLFSLVERFSPLQWGVGLIGLAIYYLVMFSYFFYHLERVVDREASRGASRLLKSWDGLYRSAWGEPFEHARDGFRRWWTALAGAAGFLS